MSIIKPTQTNREHVNQTALIKTNKIQIGQINKDAMKINTSLNNSGPGGYHSSND